VRRVILGSLVALLIGGVCVALAYLMASPGSPGVLQVVSLFFLSVGAVLLVFGLGGFVAGLVAHLLGR
jgi:hypothetical protein